MRFAAQVEYDGSAFHGWQRQREERSVQAVLEQALSRVADAPVTTICAGRTDTGVHGIGQIVHFDTQAIRTIKAWQMGSNTFLPRDVAIRAVQVVPDHFHARYSAQARSYRYIIYNADHRSALLAKRTTWIYQQLNILAMREGASCLLGQHDFSAFRAAGCQAKTPNREIKQLSIERRHNCVYIDITANAFLHNMVRIIVGSLLRVGKGENSSAWIGELLVGKDRTKSGYTAPAQGLYFVGPSYPNEFSLPKTVCWPEF